MATRDAELFKDKVEVVLDGRQIFYLFFGGAVIACLVFILGVTVGRRVEASRNPPRAGAAHDPLAALDELDAEASGELAFPAALRGDGDKPLGAVDERLKGAAKKPAASAKREGDDDDEPVASAKPIAEPVADPRPEVKKLEPARAAAPAPKGAYTLQLSSFQSRAEAEAFMANVKQAGYAPYIVEADVEGKGRWYRIRVGDYATFPAAVAAKADFESKQKVIAYVTRTR